jgi:hypothetical protein
MTATISDLDYFFNDHAIVEQCVINLPENTNAQLIHTQYINACRSYFKAKMLSCDYHDYPTYLKIPFKHLHTEFSDDSSEDVFDFDSALEILDQMLEAHITSNGDSFTLVGSAIDDSYNFFEEILDIAVTSGLFPVKQFVVQGSDYEGDEYWVTIFECHDGKMQSVYCT